MQDDEMQTGELLGVYRYAAARTGPNGISPTPPFNACPELRTRERDSC